MMKSKKILLTSLLLGFITFTVPDCAHRVVYVRKAPPPRRVVVKPAKPFPSAVWIAGYWRWHGNQYVWVNGRWVKPKKGKMWVAGHWEKRRRGWVWIDGYWR